MIQVRRSMFETNSSSTHDFVMCDKSDFDKFKKGQLSMYFGELDTLKNIKKKLLENYTDDKDVVNLINSLFDKPRKSKKELYSEFEVFFDYAIYEDCHEYYTHFVETHKSKSGDEVVAFGYYGNN